MTKFAYILSMLMALVCFTANSAAYASETDDRIKSAAKNSYVFKTYLKDDEIKVESKSGEVVLRGTVADESHKSMAEETVTRLPSVKKVDNQLEVKNGSPVAYSDAWVAAKVKTALMFHKNVDSLKTDVDVKSGVVTLKGSAESLAQRDLVTELAKDIDGVKDVKNEMSIAKGEAKERTFAQMVDDASITTQVKFMLLMRRSTSSLTTHVETKDCVVTITGVAKSGAEKDLVTKIADDIKGVKSVKNEMTVGQTTSQK